MPESLSLEFFQHLTLTGSPQGLAKFRETLRAAVSPPWALRDDSERAPPFGFDDMLGFTREADDEVGATELTLVRRGNVYELANVVPATIGQLTRGQYNYVLQDFVGRFARPAADDNDVIIELSEPTLTIEQSMGTTAATALRRFSGAANKSSGSSHPADRLRWYDFIITIQEQEVDSGTLTRWLRALGWPEESAQDLASEFEFGKGLLDREHGR